MHAVTFFPLFFRCLFDAIVLSFIVVDKTMFHCEILLIKLSFIMNLNLRLTFKFALKRKKIEIPFFIN